MFSNRAYGVFDKTEFWVAIKMKVFQRTFDLRKLTIYTVNS